MVQEKIKANQASQVQQGAKPPTQSGGDYRRVVLNPTPSVNTPTSANPFLESSFISN